MFRCLPLPYVEEEFKIDLTWRNITKDYVEPPSYAPPAAPISSIEVRLLTSFILFFANHYNLRRPFTIIIIIGFHNINLDNLSIYATSIHMRKFIYY